MGFRGIPNGVWDIKKPRGCIQRYKIVLLGYPWGSFGYQKLYYWVSLEFLEVSIGCVRDNNGVSVLLLLV